MNGKQCLLDLLGAAKKLTHLLFRQALLLTQSLENNPSADLVKDLLDPATSFAEIIESDERMTLINSESQANGRQLLQHSFSTDFHHLYQNATVIDGQSLAELERSKKYITFLVNKIHFYRAENRSLVDKSKEHLSTIRSENSCQEQLNSMKSQLANAENMIGGLTEEANAWKEKYLNLCSDHQKLIEKQSKEQEELTKVNKELRNENDELKVDLKRSVEECKRLEVDNKHLNNRLINVSTELEQIKNNFDLCADLKKDRLRAQQKCHVISEKLEACKTKCEQSTNLLREKSCLVDQQTKEIKDLNLTIIDLKKANALNQVESERNKNRIEELERKLKDKEDLVNEYKSLYHEIRNARENEIKHEQQTIEALVMINSRYESELAKMKAGLEKIRYDEMQLKKKYNAPDDDVLDGPALIDVYQPAHETLASELCEPQKQQNGNYRPPTNGHIVAKKKEALKNMKLQNGNTNGTAALPS